MPCDNSLVVIDTIGPQMAGITLIVHGDDGRSNQHVHPICLNALRGAIEMIRLPESEPDVADESVD